MVVFYLIFLSAGNLDWKLGKVLLLNNIKRNIDNDDDNDFSVRSGVGGETHRVFALLTSPVPWVSFHPHFCCERTGMLHKK